jgi:hypothetical protein
LTKENKNVLLQFHKDMHGVLPVKPVAEIIPKEPDPGNAGGGS